jgi:ATP phosphoribosyltransferase
MLRIALPNKGRLAEDARELFAEAGLPVRARGERALTASLGGEFEALFVRAGDVAEFVADGAADAGITGWDLVCESGRTLESLLDLEFGRCRLVVAAREESGITRIEDFDGAPRVATSFPRVARRYFEAAARPVEIVPVSGAVEIAPHLGIADVVVDLTETGSTLRVNGLREIATVLTSTARLVARPEIAAGESAGGESAGGETPVGTERARLGGVTDPARRRALRELVDALASVLNARGKRYLMANVPRDALTRVEEIVPGLNGPTVIDIMNGGRFVAVHAVVGAAQIYRTIAELKALGAEGILVTRIERLMP